MVLPLTAISDDALRARLWRAAEERLHASTPRTRARAGQVCLDTVAELKRRRAPLWGSWSTAAAPAPRRPEPVETAAAC